MYFADLELCFYYHPGPLDAYEWQVPLRAIGWLEHPHEFSMGTAPDGLVPRIKELANQTASLYSSVIFRGFHQCSYCRGSNPDGLLPGSHVNIFVPGLDVVYAAPAAIVHYIESHRYLPPKDFIEAVLRCPDCTTSEYREALRTANAGVEPPLKIHKVFKVVTQKAGTLLDIKSEKCQRVLDGQAFRDDATYYTIDDGEAYIYVLKHTLRREVREILATVNSSVELGIMDEEIGDGVVMKNAFGRPFFLILHARYPRAEWGKAKDEHS